MNLPLYKPQPPRRAYATLITRAAYLAGVIILGYTLRKRGSKYPLIVLYTPNLAETAVEALELEKARSGSNIILQRCEHLRPSDGVEMKLIARRFEDTWTKLRVFQLMDYDEICYLDADIAVFKNPDDIFSQTAGMRSDWILANPECVCNHDKDPWAPADFTPENCAHSDLKIADRGHMRTHQLMNGGVFVFRPSEVVWNDMMRLFEGSPELLSTFMFPDQDFLGHFFRGRWKPLGWQYNAYKTMRYWHENLWDDDRVVCVHYIVDKPWTMRIHEDGIAGYKGRDGVTHSWWWRQYDEWDRDCLTDNGDADKKLLGLVRSKVDPPVHSYPFRADWHKPPDPDMKAIGSDVQDLAQKWRDKPNRDIAVSFLERGS